MDDLYIDRLCRCLYPYLLLCFFFNDTAPPELYTLSLHDALPISVFGSAWSGLELPRHLSHFTPASLARTVQQAGGQIAWCWHRTKPRHYLWSLRILLREQGWLAVARLTETRIVYGMLKLFLELTVPLISWAERGEVIRVGIHRKAQRAAC